MAQIFGAQRWHRLASDQPPAQIGESDLFRLRGVEANATVTLGDQIDVTASNRGDVSFKLRDFDDLRGHIGLISVSVEGVPLGEIDVVPDKMSQDAYRRLRADVETVWTGLTLDPEALSHLEAGPPPPADLWKEIEGVVRQIAAQPHEELRDTVGYRSSLRVRHRRELTAATLRALPRGGSALVRVVERTAMTADNAMVADTLRRIRAYALRRGDAAVASYAARWLSVEPFCDLRPGGFAGSSYVLDQRYRQVQRVRRLLTRPDLAPVEGPGEIRLGVRGLSRLYEYWVFLQVLLQAREKYGDPIAGGFSVLRAETARGPRIDIPAGATVRFPGDIRVAFEPCVTTRPADSWAGIEYVRHPDPERAQGRATPDVVVLRGGVRPELLIIDAKYVGQVFVEKDAVKIHDKYARMLLGQTPVVSQVVAVHPHHRLAARHWAGYGHMPMNPEAGVARLPLPDLVKT
ncbi:MAG: hypothetical protein QM621_02950 [Aeromicrobium sp.]|uniref:hypothetical protein n=1 Tax=Aeromicrobium sp. TaxID=1871063 RepID=UPI0039E587C8